MQNPTKLVKNADPSLCAGRAKSEMPAITKDHFQAGAQKNTVCKFVSLLCLAKNYLLLAQLDDAMPSRLG